MGCWKKNPLIRTAGMSCIIVVRYMEHLTCKYLFVQQFICQINMRLIGCQRFHESKMKTLASRKKQVLAIYWTKLIKKLNFEIFVLCSKVEA